MDTSGDGASVIHHRESRNSVEYQDLDNLTGAREIALYNFDKQPKCIKSRVNYLKNLQYETFKLESEFYKELNGLELKYEKSFSEINNKRKNIYLGITEPSFENCILQYKNANDSMDIVSSEMNNKLSFDENRENVSGDMNIPDGDQEVKGIPDFWHTIFKNVPLLNDRIEEYDWPILRHLIDVSSIMINGITPGFKINFTFGPNEYFTNTVLSRTFYVNFELPIDNPLSFEGPEIVMSEGCKIDWKPNKNVTVKNIKEMKKCRVKGEKRSITKTCKTNSFFNFFENVTSKNEEKIKEDFENINHIDSDFEIGQYLRERIIPRAVLFYTGEGIEKDDEDENSVESGSGSESSSSDEEIVTNTRSRLLQK